jgi:uracil-DNA glycosylase
MEINESTKLLSFKKDFFEHAKKSPLYKNIEATKGNIVFGRGSDKPKILFIGEAPGFNENTLGKPFVGRSGKILDLWIQELGIGDNNFAIINVVPIIPLGDGKIRPPTEAEINYFLPHTEKYIEMLSPEIIVLLGRSAASIFDKTLKVCQVKRWKNRRLYFIYHPAYYLRNGRKGVEDILPLRELLSDKAKQETLSDFEKK